MQRDIQMHMTLVRVTMREENKSKFSIECYKSKSDYKSS